MESKNLYLYVDSVGRKIKSANLTLNQYSTNNVFHFITIGRFDNVTATFRDPSGNLSAKYHLILAGSYSLTEADTEPLLKENADNLWEYTLNPIAKRVTSIDVTGTTARLSVSFTGCSYNSKTQILQESLVASTQLVVNRADQSQEYDEAYNAEDINNLWATLNERIATSSHDEERLENLEDQVSDFDTRITANTLSIGELNNNVIPDLESDIDGKVSKTGDTMLGNLALTTASMINGGMKITAEGEFTPEITFSDPNSTHSFTISGNGDGLYPNATNAETLGNQSNTWKDIYVSGNLSNTVKAVSVADIVDTNTNQDISGSKTFTTVPKLGSNRTISGDNAVVDVKYVSDVLSPINTTVSGLSANMGQIEAIIPSEASNSNKLADKAFVNSSINANAAYFRGNFADQLALLAVQWQTSNPQAEHYVSNNDYAYVSEVVSGSDIGTWDPDDHLGEAWRFICVVSGSTINWRPQFMVNDKPFTQAQLDAINSGITSTILAGLAEKSELPTATSDLTNDSGFITIDQVPTNKITTSEFVGRYIRIDDLQSTTIVNVFIDGTFRLEDANQPQWNGSGKYVLEDNIATLSDFDNQTTAPYINGQRFAVFIDESISTVKMLNDVLGTYVNKESVYYRKDEVYNKTEVDATFATKASVPTKTSDIRNDSGFITANSIPQNTSAFNNDGDGQGSPYATISQVPTKVSDITNDTGFITSDALNGYATETYVNTAIADIDFPLTVNDVIGRWTMDPSDPNPDHSTNYILVYADGTFYLHAGEGTWDGTGIYTFDGTKFTLGNYDNAQYAQYINGAEFTVTVDPVDSRPVMTHSIMGIYKLGSSVSYTKAEADAQFATKTSLASVATSGSYNDLSNKPVIPSQTSQLTNNSGFITSAALNGYATEQYVDTAIESIGTVFDLKGSVATVSDLPSTENTIGDVWYVEAEHVGYIWIEVGGVPQWEQLGETIDLSGYATETYVDNAVGAIKTLTINDLVGVYDEGTSGTDRIYIYQDGTFKFANPGAGDTWTGTGTYVFDGEQVTLGNYDNPNVSAYFDGATFDVVVDSSTQRVKLINPSVAAMREPWYNKVAVYYTKEQSDAKFATMASLSTVATSGSYNDLTDKPTIPTTTSELTNNSGFITTAALSGYALSSDIPTDLGDLTNNAGYALTSAIPTNNNQLTNGAGYITSSALTNYALKSSVPTIPTTTNANRIVLTTSTAGTYKTSATAVGTAAYANTVTSLTSGGTGVPTSGTMYTALAAKQDKATAYNTSNVVYSETEPASPTVGMIWLKPVE